MELDRTETVKLAIQYLEVMQQGRVKPDKNTKHAFVRDSVDNHPDIQKMKTILNNYFEKELS